MYCVTTNKKRIIFSQVRGLAHTMVQLVRDIRSLRNQGVKLNLKGRFEQLRSAWADPVNASTQDHFLRVCVYC